jgi:hypothetical protein
VSQTGRLVAVSQLCAGAVAIRCEQRQVTHPQCPLSLRYNARANVSPLLSPKTRFRGPRITQHCGHRCGCRDTSFHLSRSGASAAAAFTARSEEPKKSALRHYVSNRKYYGSFIHSIARSGHIYPPCDSAPAGWCLVHFALSHNPRLPDRVCGGGTPHPANNVSDRES